MKKPKFTLVDYVIIIVVILAIVFAFIHITSDDSEKEESSAYDSSTLNKVVEKYLDYYKDGKVVKTTIEGINSTNNKPTEIHGEIVWIDDDRGSNVKVLVKSDKDNKTYLTGLYKDVSQADIYLDKMSLEVNDEKYDNLTEFTINYENISSLSYLSDKIGNYSNYEISTSLSGCELNASNYQALNNELYNNGRISIKLTSMGMENKIILVRATSSDINIANDILGDTPGTTEDITIRVYNCTSQEKKNIEDNFNVTNIKTF